MGRDRQAEQAGKAHRLGKRTYRVGRQGDRHTGWGIISPRAWAGGCATP